MAIHAHKIFMLSLLAVFFMIPQNGQAQNCNILPEVIQKLHEPRLGTYTLWDIIQGVEDMAQRYNDFIMLNEGEVILAGAQENEDLLRPLLQKINRKGRIEWMWQDKNKRGLSRPIEIIELIDQKNGFLTMGQIYRERQPHAIWIGKFSHDGRKQAEFIISEPARDLVYGGLTPSLDGNGWVLAATEKRLSGDKSLGQAYSRFIRLNKEFSRVMKRSFMPGPENAVHDLQIFQSPSGEKFYIAAGEMEDGSGRLAGLAMRLDENLNVIWQRLYPRGGGLKFLDVKQAADGEVLIAGTARPIDPEAPDAGTAIKLQSSNGKEIWQRYFMRDDLAYEGVGLVATPDGRSHILMQGADQKDEKTQNHARIVTLSPRGEFMNEISYTAGKGATPYKIHAGVNNLLTISGQALMEDPDPNDPKNKVILRKKGWFLVGEPFGIVEDPCKIEERPF